MKRSKIISEISALELEREQIILLRRDINWKRLFEIALRLAYLYLKLRFTK